MDVSHVLSFLVLIHGVFVGSDAYRYNDCTGGRYGEDCESTCHCLAKSCDGDGICDYGCAPEWSGSYCRKEKKPPTITYQCLNPDDESKQMKMTIQTHGVFYRDVSVVDENKKELGWCWDTEVSSLHEPRDVITVKIELTSRARRDMRRGSCAGKIIADDVYEWLLTVQEWKKVSLGMEQNLRVRCNFSQSEAHTRSINVTPTDMQPIHFTELEEVRDNVSLVLLDDVTRMVITTAPLGHPVVLQMRYGTPVKSITPHNCYVASADQGRWQQIVDYNGCNVSDSPVKPFEWSKDSNAVETPWFPYFAYSGSLYTQFQCSYTICHDKSCPLGCTRTRHIRSASQADVQVKTSSP